MHKPVLDENGQRLNGIRREKLRRTKDLQRLMEFRLLDDDFLAACCYGDTVCAELILRIILEKPDLRVLDVQAHVSSEQWTAWKQNSMPDCTARTANPKEKPQDSTAA